MYYALLQRQKPKSKLDDRQQKILGNACGSNSTHRQLLKFKKVDEIIYLAQRLFQREPDVSLTILGVAKKFRQGYCTWGGGVIHYVTDGKLNIVIINAPNDLQIAVFVKPLPGGNFAL